MQQLDLGYRLPSLADIVSTRFVRSALAIGGGRVFSMLYRLAEPPVFLTVFGREEYAEWIVICAIGASFALAEVGIGTVVRNKLASGADAVSRDRSIELYQSTVTIFSFLIFSLIATMVVLSLMDVSLLGDRTPFTSVLDGLAIYHVALGVALRSLANIIILALAGADRYHQTFYFSNFIVLGEFATIITAAISFRDLEAIAYSWMVYGFVAVLSSIIIITVKCPEFFVARHVKKIVRGMPLLIRLVGVRMLFPLGWWINLNGVPLILATLSTASAVVTYSVLRTLSGVVGVMGMVLGQALQPTLASKAAEKAAALLRATLWFVLLATASAGMLTWIVAPEIVRLWSGLDIDRFDPALGVLLALGAVRSLWMCMSSRALGLNLHSALAWAHLFLIGLLAASLFALGWSVGGLTGAVWGSFGAESLMFVVVLLHYRSLFTDREREIWHQKNRS